MSTERTQIRLTPLQTVRLKQKQGKQETDDNNSPTGARNSRRRSGRRCNAALRNGRCCVGTRPSRLPKRKAHSTYIPPTSETPPTSPFARPSRRLMALRSRFLRHAPASCVSAYALRWRQESRVATCRITGRTTTTLQIEEGVFEPHGAFPNLGRASATFAATDLRVPVFAHAYGILVNTKLVPGDGVSARLASADRPQVEGQDSLRRCAGAWWWKRFFLLSRKKNSGRRITTSSS